MIPQKSPTAKSLPSADHPPTINTIYARFSHLCKCAIETGEIPPLLLSFELFSFVKPVEGKMYRRGEFVEKHFYDEREWRYVPTLIQSFTEFTEQELAAQYRLSREEFLDEVKKANANRELGARVKLTFEPTDIRYIIVSDESEIVSMIQAVRRIKQRFDARTVDLLSSRIISATQIIEDF